VWVEVLWSQGLHLFNILTLEVALNLLRCKHGGKAIEGQHLAQLSAVARLPYARFITERVVVQVEKAEFGSYFGTSRSQRAPLVQR